jgi:hypothetical protein
MEEGKTMQDERRSYSRYRTNGAAYVVGETEHGPFEIRGVLENVSPAGMGVTLAGRLPVGTVVWCAVPSYGLYERGQVCHSSGSLLRKQATGIRFLAPPTTSE